MHFACFAVCSVLCVCLCVFLCVCVWGHGRFADTNLPSTLYVLFVSHLLHATHRQRQRRASSHALLPSTTAQPSVAVTMPIMQYKLRLIVNAKLLSSRRQLVLVQNANASYAQCNKTCNKLLNLISSTQRERVATATRRHYKLAARNYISFYFYYPLITYFLLMLRSIKAINDRVH